jgi:salicylate hydroxylase
MASDILDIAIVGGGIAGLTLAIALARSGAKIRIYEQARSFREIGTGIGFSPNAERAMHLVDSRIHAGFRKITTQNASNWFPYVDGFGERGEDARLAELKVVFQLDCGERGLEGYTRSEFIDELVKIIPEGIVEFRKRLSSIVEKGHDEKLVLKFEDGTTAEADAGVCHY